MPGRALLEAKAVSQTSAHAAARDGAQTGAQVGERR